MIQQAEKNALLLAFHDSFKHRLVSLIKVSGLLLIEALYEEESNSLISSTSSLTWFR